MACTTIRRHHPIEAVLDNWRTSSGIASNISGTLELFQESEFDATFGKLKIKGLNRMASGYHIHRVMVIAFCNHDKLQLLIVLGIDAVGQRVPVFKRYRLRTLQSI